MNAARQMHQKFSLRKSLEYAGVSRRMWYHKPKAREIGLNQATAKAVQRIGAERPTYGTRRMAAQVTRETNIATNRKQIQRVFKKLGWIEPKKTKNDIIRTKHRLFKPDAPNRLWEMDITYIWCGVDGWCYCFNVLDCFTRRWVSYAFDVNATRHAAIDSITNAVAAERPDRPELRIRTDNGSQYTSNDFRRAVSVLGIRHEFIWKNTPEQNGHIESFHKTLKKEYIWPCEFTGYQEAEKALADALSTIIQRGSTRPSDTRHRWSLIRSGGWEINEANYTEKCEKNVLLLWGPLQDHTDHHFHF